MLDWLTKKLWRILPGWCLRRWIADRKGKRHHCHIVVYGDYFGCVYLDCPVSRVPRG